MNIPHRKLSVDINRINHLTVDLIGHINDKNTRYIDLTFTVDGAVIELEEGCTASVTYTSDGFLIAQDVSCEIENNAVVIGFDNEKIEHARSGILAIQPMVTDSNDNILALQIPIYVRVSADIAQTSQVDGNSMGSYAEVVREIAEARGEEESLGDRVDSMQDDVDSIDIQLSAKANKATTLAGYKISDAYTKSEAEERIDESFELKTLFPNNSGSSDGYLINEVISPGSSGYRDEYCCLFGGATHATGLDALTPENFGESYHIEIFLDNVNIRGIIFQELRTGESGGINYPSAWNVSLSQEEYTSLSGTKIEHDYTMGATTTSIFRMRLRCNGNNRQQVRVRITKNRGLERTSNKVTVIDPNTATDEQYVSALAVVNYINSVLGRGASQND